jgi:hypothetical protein
LKGGRSQAAEVIGPTSRLIDDAFACDPPASRRRPHKGRIQLRNTQIKVGQRFRDPQPTAFGNATVDLVIRRVFIGTDGKEYAEVHSATDPSNIRTLSTATLKDRRRVVEVRGHWRFCGRPFT